MTTAIDFDWRFALGDPHNAEMPEFDDSMWRILDVPHDWAIEGEYGAEHPTGMHCGFVATGIGWYRKDFDVPKDWLNQRVEIQFDAVYMNSEVWINGHYLGKRPYGYISFNYDLTDHLKPGRNVIAVRVDNSQEPSSRWYNGAGIYGHVRLASFDQVHVPTCGTYVTTPAATETEATVHIETKVISHSRNVEMRVESQILGPAGEHVTTVTSTCQVGVGCTETVTQETTVANPKRWSPDTPHLYSLCTRVLDGDIVLDETTTTFGIRHLEYNSTQGFLLNGVQTKLKGVCEHHDGGSVGAAMPDKVLVRRIQILKDMGCNAIRTAHNPRTPFFYETCDRMGMMVMDEIFDGWHKKVEYDYGSRAFDEWWRRDVEDWVVRDRNHACIVMWSIGNETGKEDKHDITGFVKTFDKTRPVTCGSMLNDTDIAGFNGGGETPGVLERYKEENPDRRIVLTEVPHTYQTRGFYRVLNWWRDSAHPERRHDIPSLGNEQIFFGGHLMYSSSYDNSGIRMCARSSWKRTKELDWIIGEFRWTGFDYLGESWVGNGYLLRFWNHGIIDLCGFPKDTYYFYQSQWRDMPMVHLLPHWTHRGMNGTEIPVVAYSSCDEVELFLNGESLGRQKRGDLLDFQWKVPYQPGELKAIAYAGGEVAAETVQQTAADPEAILLESDNLDLKVDRLDVAHLTFTVQDGNGVMVPWSNDPIHFEFSGPVLHLGFENGNIADVDPHRIKRRNVFHGMGLGIFQATDAEGTIEITAAGVLGDDLFPESTTAAITVNRISLRGALDPTEFEVHYTLDGSKPASTSPRYESTIALAETTTVNVLVLRDGQPFMEFSREFRKGEKTRFEDPRLLLPNGESSTKTAGYVGPFAEEIIGLWLMKKENRTLEFEADGEVFEHLADGSRKHVAHWWYETPNDVFEDPDDTGAGGFCWLHLGDRDRLKLTSLDSNGELYFPNKMRLGYLQRVKD